MNTHPSPPDITGCRSAVCDVTKSSNEAVNAIAAALRLSIADAREARRAAFDSLVALKRSGFLVVTASAPAGSR
jgi:hypothetical protein